MSINDKRLLIGTTWTSADQTVGKCGFVAIVARGSGDASQVTLADGTAIRYIVEIAATSLAGFTLPKGQAFTNLVADLTGTASYAICYQPLT